MCQIKMLGQNTLEEQTRLLQGKVLVVFFVFRFSAQIATCCFAREIYLDAFNLNAKDLCIASLLNKVLHGSA